MLNAKIKISQVNNLTDARYFSAWGVEYLGFDIDPESPSFISPPLLKEITEWVEGPSIILESANINDQQWIDNYKEAVGDVLTEQKVLGRDNLLMLQGQSLDHKTVVTYVSGSSWSSISISSVEKLVREYDEVFLDIPFAVSEMDMILDTGITGFVIRGGQEEKTGFKSYDDLDEIFEHLSN